MADKKPTPSKNEKSTLSAEEERTKLVPKVEPSSSVQTPPLETKESSAVPDAEQSAEAVPGTSTSFFSTITSTIQIKFKRFTDRKKYKGESWYIKGKKQKISKQEYARKHGGYVHSDMESAIDTEESSGVATESSVAEESSVAQSPLEKEFPDKPASKDEHSDEDAPPMEH